jgi:hypothetical protein
MKAERFFEGTRVRSPLEPASPAPDTRQTIFDRVVRHYRAQPQRCPAKGNCFYRFDDLMCFVGRLIDDAHYVDGDDGMEGYRVHDLVKLFAMPQWFRDNLDFIKDLQDIHDTETNWPDGRMDIVLELFAEERGLKMPDERIM